MKGNIKDKFSVGPLMYSPALNENLAQTIISGRLGKGYSIALCLEDTISDVLLPKAENQVVETFKELYKAISACFSVYLLLNLFKLSKSQ